MMRDILSIRKDRHDFGLDNLKPYDLYAPITPQAESTLLL